MGSSKNETVGNTKTRARNVDRRAARGLAALVGLGICLRVTGAAAYPTAQGQVTQVAQQRAGAVHKVVVTRVKNEGKQRLIVAGAATLGSFWAASAITAAVVKLNERERAERAPCALQMLCPRYALAPSGKPATLLIPVVGPWIGLGTLPHTNAGAVGLTVLGVGQAIGVGMLIGGLTLPTEIQVTKGQVIQMRAAPLVGPDGLGLSIQGSM